jgi:hypothetical protein
MERIVGGTLYLDGVEVEAYREDLMLDIKLNEVNDERLETINIFIGKTRIATLPAQLGPPLGAS